MYPSNRGKITLYDNVLSGTSQSLLKESQKFFRIPETRAYTIPLYLTNE